MLAEHFGRHMSGSRDMARPEEYADTGHAVWKTLYSYCVFSVKVNPYRSVFTKQLGVTSPSGKVEECVPLMGHT